jgi:hypothetical protein
VIAIKTAEYLLVLLRKDAERHEDAAAELESLEAQTPAINAHAIIAECYRLIRKLVAAEFVEKKGGKQ